MSRHSRSNKSGIFRIQANRIAPLSIFDVANNDFAESSDGMFGCAFLTGCDISATSSKYGNWTNFVHLAFIVLI
jgi:hypothetical protein